LFKKTIRKKIPNFQWRVETGTPETPLWVRQWWGSMYTFTGCSKKVSHYRRSSLNRIKNRKPG